MSTKEIIKISDDYGFIYEVEIEHTPNYGFSTAYYQGRIIAQAEIGRILEPISDDDNEWEMYQERFGEWRDEIKSILMLKLNEHFKSNPTRPGR